MLTKAPAPTTASKSPPLKARRRNLGDASRPGTTRLPVGRDLRRRPRNPVVDHPAGSRSLPGLLQADVEDLRLHLLRVLGQQRHLEDGLVGIRLVDLERRRLDLLRGVVD